MNPSKFVEQATEDIKQRKLAVFCGAGVSFQSGVPTVAPLVSRIFNSLGMERAIIDKISTSAIPFELIMEQISKEASITSLLDVFDADRPNAAHHLIARLAVIGMIDTIITTNFDELFEHSLEMAGAIKGKDYIVAAARHELLQLDWSERRVKVVKLHGTISDKQNLGVTLNSIAAGTEVVRMSEVMKQLFLNPGLRSVLVLGYSCSDSFDIGPAIESCAPSPTRVLFIDHSQSGSWKTALVEPVGAKLAKNPFHDYEGERLFAETGQVIAHLWSTFFPGEEQPREHLATREWGSIVDEWARRFRRESGTSVGYRITAYFLLYLNEYQLARAVLERAEGGVESRSMIAYTYQMEGELEKAAEILWKAANDAKSKKDIIGFLQYSGSLAEVTRQSGKPKEAIQLLEENVKALDRMAVDLPEIRTVAMGLWAHIKCNQLTYVGNAYLDLERAVDAERSFEQAREVAVSAGDKIGETYSLGGLARALRLQGKAEEAEDFVTQPAIRIANQIGSPELVRKLSYDVIRHRTRVEPTEKAQVKRMFETTDHQIKRSQSELLLQFMELLEKSPSLGTEEKARRFATFQGRELTCWECGHIFPLLKGLAPPPNVLVCPQCHSTLAGFR